MSYTNPMLEIDEESQTDDSIQSYKRFLFQPISGVGRKKGKRRKIGRGIILE